MSELITNAGGKNFRWQLFTTVSAASLALASAAAHAQAGEDASHPTVWIELGGQLEAIGGKPDLFTPPFVAAHLDAPYNSVSPVDATHPASNGFGGEGRLSFRPEGSDWVFSAAVRYGRSNRDKHLHQQTTTSFRQKTNKYNPTNPKFRFRDVRRFSDATVDQNESHAVMDFMAGRDVGLGMFHGQSTLNFGVRIAQFHSRANSGFKSFPDPHYSTKFTYNDPGAHHHSYAATAELTRNFRGVGPSVAWEGNAAMVGRPDAGHLTFDWGVDASVLFGRQTINGEQQTSTRYFHGSPFALPPPPTTHTFHTSPVRRSRTVIVPNAGGFAGLSVRYPNAKVSLGYRADFFFGAMDGGIDTRKSVTPGFYGPFATVSIGLGG